MAVLVAFAALAAVAALALVLAEGPEGRGRQTVAGARGTAVTRSATAQPAVLPSASDAVGALAPTRVYVVDTAGGDIATRILVVDLATQAVIRTIEVAYNPQLVVSPDGRRLYIGETEIDRNR